MEVAVILLVCAISLAQSREIERNENGCIVNNSFEIFYPHKNCNKYYQCMHGNLLEITCPLDLLFDVQQQRCEWSHDVDCGDRIIPEAENEDTDSENSENGDNESNGTCNCNPEEAPSICAQDGSDGTLIAHEYCYYYYICSDGKAIAMRCPEELYYNRYTEQCDWPHNVKCGDRLIPDSNDSNENNYDGDNTCNCDPEEAPSICSSDESDGVFVAHINCNQYYICSGGKPVAMTCPEGLLFNPYRNLCDWPHKVECGDRVIPDPSETDNDNGNVDNDNGDNEDSGTCNCDPEEAPSICSSDETDGVFVAHINCNQYYICSGGKPVAMTCPEGLLFNPYRNLCDWPHKVECGDRVIPDPSETDNDNGNEGNDNGDNDDSGTCNCDPEEAPSICSSDESDGVFVAHINCNQYYICSGGKPVAMTCPEGLLFNPYRNLCDWPHKVECGDRVIPDPSETDNDNGNVDNDNGDNEDSGTCNCDPEEAPSICSSDETDGVFVAHINCNQYYICSGGKPVAMTCPEGLLFNPYRNLCDWPHKVECGDRVIPDPSETDNDNGNEGNDNGDNEDSGTCNCDPEEAPSICSSDESDGVFVAHINCNQYYICSGGKPVAMTCPEGLLFNPYRNLCDWPHKVECGDRVIPDPSEIDNDNGNEGNDNGDNEDSGTCNCDPEEAPSICSSDESDGVFVAHINCNQYYICSGGKPVAMTCPEGLLFNPYKNLCDWPHKVKCGDRVIPDPSETDNDNGNEGNDNGDNEDSGTCNCDPEEAPSICSSDESDGVFVAHINCNQYYICSGGKPVAMTCPEGLLFNPYRNLCDWPHKVECGDRVIPDPSEIDNDNGNEGNDNGDNEDSGTCNCDPEEAPSICSSDESDGVFVAHINCNQYYICSGGKPVAMTCPEGLLFNPYRNLCDWPHKVECGDRVIPDPSETDNDNGNEGNDNGDNEDSGTCNCDPEEAPSICSSDESDGVFVAHINCNQYYICSGGKPVAMTCPEGLLFNPYKNLCGWPHKVECGDRVIPDPSETDNENSNEENDNGDNNDTGTCNCDPDEAPTICANSESEGVFVAHIKCNQYYVCSGGKPIALSCPRGLLFNPYANLCDWPHKVECGDRVLPDLSETDNDNGNEENDSDDNNNTGTCNCDPEEAPSICSSDESDGVFVAHINCNQYYICSGGKPVEMNCPGGLLFNPYRNLCDWSQNVKCADRVIPGPNENDNDDGNEDNDNGDNENSDTCNCDPEKAPSICNSGESEGILVAHENCNQFYMCSGGQPVAMNCQEGLLYNSYTERCDWPANVKCGERVIPELSENDSGDGTGGNNNGDDSEGGTCNCNPAEAASICGKTGSEGVLVAHENCNQFYICSNANPIIFSCQPPLMYNPYKEQCDWPRNVKCDDRIIPESDDNNEDIENEDSNDGVEIYTPIEAAKICAQEQTDITFLTHEICNQFYICSNGKATALTCPGDLLYDPINRRCEWTYNVNCRNRTTPEILDSDKDNNNNQCNCNPALALVLCIDEDSNGKLIAHENCNQFYMCAQGSPIAMSCPSTLFYNPHKEICDWPRNFDCEDRLYNL